jgi:glutamyl-tRNA synthetase
MIVFVLVGHAQTFHIAMKRSQRSADGELILRIEDLDRPRCKVEYLSQMIHDMTWFGLTWTHGPQSLLNLHDSTHE